MVHDTVQILRDPEHASAILQPARLKVLEHLAEPASASMLARLPGLPRQPLKYHLRWQWFAPMAEVEPGLGGKVTVGWGPGMEGTAPISGWEPGSRFAWAEDHGPGGKRVMECTLEAQGGKAKLRLIHSGFGTEASFDNEFDSTHGGWLTFLACLRYYLDTMRSASGRHEARITISQGDPGELWVRLTSGMGLSGQNLSAGTPYRATLPDGESFSGIVVASPKARYAVLRVDEMGENLLALFCESFGGGCAFTASWYLYGAGLADNSPLLAGWNQYYDSLTSTEGAAA